jgi:glycosyltransferase involved in cell wall biosynthesis
MIIQAYLPHVGGAERQLAALAPRIKAHGFEVIILTRRYSGLPPFEEIDGIPVHRLPIPGPKIVASLSFTFSALLLLRKLKPDVIHAHELLSPATTAIAAKRLLGTPVLVKVLRGGILGDLAKIKNRPFGSQRIRQFRRWLDALAVISREIDKELAEIGIDESKRVFIPNGVDTNRFFPANDGEKSDLRKSLRLPTNAQIAVFTGRLAAEKRVDILLRAWNRTHESYPATHLVILGTGEEEESLKSIAHSGVSFFGMVDNVPEYLRAADFFILPSNTEGLSNALLEAMACGLPIIATSVGGAPDLITHEKNGWLVSPDNEEALHTLLINIFSTSPSHLAEVGQAALQIILEDYTLAKTEERLVNLYQRLLTKGHK